MKYYNYYYILSEYNSLQLIFTGKTIIKDGVNGFPSYFMNGAIYGSKTDYQEDDVRLNAVLPNGRKTASVKTPRDLPLERQSP